MKCSHERLSKTINFQSEILKGENENLFIENN